MSQYLGEVCVDIKSPLHIPPSPLHMSSTNGYLKLPPSSDFADLAKGSFLDNFRLFPEIDEKIPPKLMELDGSPPPSPEHHQRTVFTSLENSEIKQEPSSADIPPVPPSPQEEVPVKKRRRRRRKEKKDKDKPKKSPSAYILWLTEARKGRVNSNISAAELTRVLAEEWKTLEDKSKWHEEADRLKKKYLEERERYKQKMQIRIEEAINSGILQPNQSDNLYTLSKKLISRDSYDEMADPKKQRFTEQIRSLSPSYYSYFAEDNEVSSLSENEDWVLTKAQKKRKDKAKQLLLQKKKKLRKKRDKLKPKKPPSSYLLYLSELRPQLAQQFPQLPMTEITAKISELWNACQDREKWNEEAKLRKEKYKLDMLEYEKLREGGDTAPSEVQPSLPNKPAKRTRRRHLPKDPSKPKKPQTAFLLFLNGIREKIKKEHPGIVLADLTKEAGQRWKALTDKKEWEEKAQRLKVKHQEDMKEYNEKKKPEVPPAAPQLPSWSAVVEPMEVSQPPVSSSSSQESDSEEEADKVVHIRTPADSTVFTGRNKVTVERLAPSEPFPVCCQEICTPSEDSLSDSPTGYQIYPELDDHSYSKSYSPANTASPATTTKKPPTTPRYFTAGKPSIYDRRWKQEIYEEDSSE